LMLALTVPPPLWVNGSTSERRTFGSSVTDFSAIYLSSIASVKSNVCVSGVQFTSEAKAW
jgi:hypothetical protein